MEEDERVWLEQSKGGREKDRKFSSTYGTRTHDLLLSGQAHTSTGHMYVIHTGYARGTICVHDMHVVQLKCYGWKCDTYIHTHIGR